MRAPFAYEAEFLLESHYSTNVLPSHSVVCALLGYL